MMHKWWRLVKRSGAGHSASTVNPARLLLDTTPPRAPHRIAYGADPQHFGDLWLPQASGPHPLLVFIHGGYWRARYNLEHAGFLCQALAQAGIAVWNIEYRRLGNPGGGYPGTFQDVARALLYVRQLAQDFPLAVPQRVAVMGHSAGGQLALWAAGAHRLPVDHPLHTAHAAPLRAVLCVGGVTDLRRAWELGLSDQVVAELLGGGPDEVPERYLATSPIERLPLDMRQIILHGTEEEVVPVEFANRYVEAARAAGDDVALLWLPGMGHFEPLDPRSPAWPIVHGSVGQALGL